MALKGKYEQARVAVKVIQWLGCIFVLSMIAAGSMFCFEKPMSISSFKWVQLFQSMAMFLLPPLCMAYLWTQEPMKWLKIDKRPRMNVSLMAIILILLALPAINLMGYINQQMVFPSFLEPLEQWLKMQEETAGQLTKQFMHTDTYSGLVINILLMAVLPAVAEELSFRGVLMNLFPAKGDRVPHLAIWCVAILFSAVHMQFYGFLPRMLMGALFGYALVWTGNLWVPILMHFTNNAMAVLLYFVSMRMNWDMKMIDAIGTNDTLWLGVVSLVITLVGIYAFRRSTTMSSASSRMSNGN